MGMYGLLRQRGLNGICSATLLSPDSPRTSYLVLVLYTQLR